MLQLVYSMPFLLSARKIYYPADNETGGLTAAMGQAVVLFFCPQVKNKIITPLIIPIKFQSNSKLIFRAVS